jgi:serine/threonine-protein kinase
VLAPQHVKTEKARELFRREVLAAGRLMHPNIVTAYDAGCTDGRYFLAMEFVDGPNLDQLVRERGPLPAGLACDIIRQAAYGLQRAHELGMVHRDVKPSNLLVEPGPTAGAPCVVKILDFGLARLHAPSSPRKQGTILTRDNTIMGTPDYLSPEQSRSLHAVDIRSDLYSLGCTFYHTLTGQVPFPGGTTLEKLIRQASEEPTPLERQRPDLPEAVCAVVRKLMAKDPANRFQTPAELAAALAPVAVAGSAEFRLGPGGVAALVDTGTGTPGTLAPDEAAEEDTEQIAEQALARTLPQDSSPTALSGDELPIPFDDWEQGQRTRNALYWSLGVVAGLVGLIVAAVALGR